MSEVVETRHILRLLKARPEPIEKIHETELQSLGRPQGSPLHIINHYNTAAAPPYSRQACVGQRRRRWCVARSNANPEARRRRVAPGRPKRKNEKSIMDKMTWPKKIKKI
jgi:hypothetical protein